MEHQFNIDLAKLYGVDEAIILHNMFFWIKKNEANKKHYYDGNYWTYNSIESFTILFPYWSKRQIERILSSLLKKGAIIKGNYNKVNYDRTSWYAIHQTVKSIYVNGEIEFTKRVNRIHQTVSPIPDSNTYSKLQIENSNKLKLSGDATTSVKSSSSKSATMNDKAEYFIKKFNEIMAIKGKNREFKVNEDVKKKLKKAIEGGYTFEDIKIALENLKKDDHHIKTGFKYATPEFILRLDKLERFRNLTPIIQNKQLIV